MVFSAERIPDSRLMVAGSKLVAKDGILGKCDQYPYVGLQEVMAADRCRAKAEVKLTEVVGLRGC